MPRMTDETRRARKSVLEITFNNLDDLVEFVAMMQDGNLAPEHFRIKEKTKEDATSQKGQSRYVLVDPKKAPMSGRFVHAREEVRYTATFRKRREPSNKKKRKQRKGGKKR